MKRTNLKGISALALGCSVSLFLFGQAGMNVHAEQPFTSIKDGYYRISGIDAVTAANKVRDTFGISATGVDAAHKNTKTSAPATAGAFTGDQFGLDLTGTSGELPGLLGALFSLGKRTATKERTTNNVKQVYVPLGDHTLSAAAANDLRDALTSPFIAAVPAVSNSTSLMSNLFGYDNLNPDFMELDLGLGRIEYAQVGVFSDMLFDSNLEIAGGGGLSTNALVTWLNRYDTASTDDDKKKIAVHLFEPGQQYGAKIAWSIPVSENFNIKVGAFAGQSTGSYGGIEIAKQNDTDAQTKSNLDQHANLVDSKEMNGTMLEIGGLFGVKMEFDTGAGTVLADIDAYGGWARLSSERTSSYRSGLWSIPVTWSGTGAANSNITTTFGPEVKPAGQGVTAGYSKGTTADPSGSGGDYTRTDTLTFKVPDKLSATGNKGFHGGVNVEATYISPSVFQEAIFLNAGAMLAFDFYSVPELIEDVELEGAVPDTVKTTYTKLQGVTVTDAAANGADFDSEIGYIEADFKKFVQYYSSQLALKSAAVKVMRLDALARFGISVDFGNISQSATALPVIFDMSLFGGYKYAPELPTTFSPVLSFKGADKTPKRTVKYGAGSHAVMGGLLGLSIVTESIVVRFNYKMSMSAFGVNHSGALRLNATFR